MGQGTTKQKLCLMCQGSKEVNGKFFVLAAGAGRLELVYFQNLFAASEAWECHWQWVSDSKWLKVARRR